MCSCHSTYTCSGPEIMCLTSERQSVLKSPCGRQMIQASTRLTVRSPRPKIATAVTVCLPTFYYVKENALCPSARRPCHLKTPRFWCRFVRNSTSFLSESGLASNLPAKRSATTEVGVKCLSLTKRSSRHCQWPLVSSFPA